MKKLMSAFCSSLFLLSAVACGQTPLIPTAQLSRQSVSGPMMVRANAAPTAGRQANSLRLATYNIRNLFDGIQNPGKEAEKPKPTKELVALGQSMHDINADVLGFQEVESKEVLSQFRDKYLADMGYREVVLIEGNDTRGIDVALFSRYPVTNVKSHKDVRFPVAGEPQPVGFSRDLLQVRIQGPNNYAFTVFVAHLKSHHGGAPADVRREAEARAAQQIIGAFQKANPRENFVVMGDFNDAPNAKPVQPLVNPQVSGLGLTDVIMKDLGNGPEVYTYHPKQYRSRIDYLLLSPSMMNEYVPKSVSLYKPFKQGDQWQKLYFYDASDHIPVTLDLNISADR
jgi:endonuclease/exonuclease/phosphatase family metal-dependent hydrolase